MRLAALLAAALFAGGHAVATDPAAPYRPEQVKVAVEQYVQRKVAEGGGVYRLVDERTGQAVELEYVFVGVVSPAEMWKVHDPARPGAAQGYFACARFHPVGAPAEKVYDVDFAVEPRSGELAVTGTRVHKVTQLEAGKWVWREAASRATR